MHRIQGDEAHFSQDARSMHFVFALAIASLSFFLVFDLLNLATYLFILILAGIFILSVGLYLSRIKRKTKAGFIFFQAGAYLLLPFGFFFNEGIDGPVIYIFFISLLVHFVANPTGNINVFVIWHSLLIAACLLLELFVPELSQKVYATRTTRFMDFLLTGLLAILFFAYVFKSIRHDFLKNRAIIDLKSKKLLEQHASLEKALMDKEKLLNIIAHDLRSPLNTIQDYLALLQETKIEGQSRVVLEEKLRNLTQGASEMLTDLMEWRKEKNTATEIKPISLSAIIKSVLAILSERAEKKQIQIDQLSGLEEYNVMADESLLQIVVRNILDNAVKFTNKEGRIVLSVSNTESSTTLHIKDNGIGMNKPTLDRLFDQIITPNTGTWDELGSGMGLYVCKDLMGLMQGDIKVSSELKKGSEFHLILPSAK